jgi:hypothetical protein
MRKKRSSWIVADISRVAFLKESGFLKMSVTYLPRWSNRVGRRFRAKQSFGDRGITNHKIGLRLRDNLRRFAPRMLATWIVLATFLALWPFDFVRPCIFCENAARIDTELGQLTFPSQGLARASVTNSFLQRLIESNLLVIELWVTPSNTWQEGPARILSYSSNAYERNFTIAQDRDALQLRLRTSAADVNGLSGQVEVNEAFSAGQLTYILIISNAEGTAIAVNSTVPELVNTKPADFSSWSESYDLIIGNEATGGRPWLGDIHRIVIRNSAQESVLGDFDFSGNATREEPLLTEEDLSFPSTVPFKLSLHDDRFAFQDLVRHFAMLFPVGLLYYTIVAKRRVHWHGMLLSVVPIFGFASLIEFLQFFILSHTTSFLDLIWGVLGGLAGAMASAAIDFQPKR